MAPRSSVVPVALLYWLFLATVFLCHAPAQMAVIYQPAQNYTAFVLPPDTPIWPVQACPNGTGNVLSAFYNLGLETQYISLGCCEIGQYGIPLSQYAGIAGCCPLGLFPCLDNSGSLVGCSRDPSRCGSNGMVCPPGYGYCPTGVAPTNNLYFSDFPCCPLLNATNDPSNYTAYCEVFDSADYLAANFGDPLYGGCSQTVLAESTLCFDSTIYQFSNNTNITYPFNSTIYCNAYDNCVDLVADLGPTNITFDNVTYYTVEQYQSNTIGCCPPTLQPCVDNSGSLIACANQTAGEVCCGDSLCPLGSSCCSQGSGFNTTYYGCCASGLDCCYLPLSIFNPAFMNVTQMFCGSISADNCTQNMYTPQSAF